MSLQTCAGYQEKKSTLYTTKAKTFTQITQEQFHQYVGNQKGFNHHHLLIQKCFLNNKQVSKLLFLQV